ncbi:MAG: DNA-directed RNA polymerase subunit alpha [Proteobacteria bacterium]|nr:DNA-directed RNA polymerase subunit alpha [Pseudomonadota bacterium]
MMEETKSVFGCLGLTRPAEYFLTELSGNVSVFKVEPLEKGFGATLGNALRRIMMSSIRGASIIAIKIDGIDHEFSSMEGMTEDVVELMLNIKDVAIKYTGPSKKKAFIDVTGPMAVNAGMIVAPSEVEIMNPELHICNLAEGTHLKIDLVIGTGIGYATADEHDLEGMSTNALPIDALFSPIRRVVYSVERSRIGEQTEFDRLLITIETDGSIDAGIALSQASRIMIDQLSIFICDSDPASVEQEQKQEPEINPNLLKKVEDLELSVRSHNCLKNDNIVYVGDLVTKTEQKMLQTPNFGKKSLCEIKDVLNNMNLSFGIEIKGGWPPPNLDELIQKNSGNKV